MTQVKFKLINKKCTPERKTTGAACFDLRANIEKEEILHPREFCTIPLGVAFEVPEDLEVQIRSRSGLAFKHGVAVLNAPGTIDSDYRGEVHAILFNMGQHPYRIQPLERIAQAKFATVPAITLARVAELGETERGHNGFGSTGKG